MATNSVAGYTRNSNGTYTNDATGKTVGAKPPAPSAEYTAGARPYGTASGAAPAATTTAPKTTTQPATYSLPSNWRDPNPAQQPQQQPTYSSQPIGDITRIEDAIKQMSGNFSAGLSGLSSGLGSLASANDQTASSIANILSQSRNQMTALPNVGYQGVNATIQQGTSPRGADKNTAYSWVRDFAGQIGGQAGWDGKQAHLDVNGRKVSFSPGSSMVTIDGRTVNLGKPVVFQNGKAMIPVRALSEALGANVGYNQGQVSVTGQISPSEYVQKAQRQIDEIITPQVNAVFDELETMSRAYEDMMSSMGIQYDRASRSLDEAWTETMEYLKEMETEQTQVLTERLNNAGMLSSTPGVETFDKMGAEYAKQRGKATTAKMQGLSDLEFERGRQEETARKGLLSTIGQGVRSVTDLLKGRSSKVFDTADEMKSKQEATDWQKQLDMWGREADQAGMSLDQQKLGLDKWYKEYQLGLQTDKYNLDVGKFGFEQDKFANQYALDTAKHNLNVEKTNYEQAAKGAKTDTERSYNLWMALYMSNMVDFENDPNRKNTSMLDWLQANSKAIIARVGTKGYQTLEKSAAKSGGSSDDALANALAKAAKKK